MAKKPNYEGIYEEIDESGDYTFHPIVDALADHPINKVVLDDFDDVTEEGYDGYEIKLSITVQNRVYHVLFMYMIMDFVKECWIADKGNKKQVNMIRKLIIDEAKDHGWEKRRKSS